MKAETFETMILEKRIEKIKTVLGNKAKEYSSYKDRLHNFKVAARIQNTTPEKAAFGMALKHLVSVMDIIENTPKKPSKEMVDEKIGDLINYLVLIEALLLEDQFKPLEDEIDKHNPDIEIFVGGKRVEIVPNPEFFKTTGRGAIIGYGKESKQKTKKTKKKPKRK